MKDFLEKYKKVLIIVLIVFLFLGILTGIYFLFLKESNLFKGDEVEKTESTEVVEEKEVTPRPEYIITDSDVVLKETFAVAADWALDVKLVSCDAVPISKVVFTDITYEWLGADDGLYAQWLCTFTSKSKNADLVIEYDEGDLDYDYEDAIDGGMFGSAVYDNLPTVNFEKVVKSSTIFANINDSVADGNYVAMYLADTTDYGFVWRAEERSKTEEDEYGINKIVKSYVFDMYSGELKATLEEEIY